MQSTCQGNCVYFTTLFATTHYNKRSVVDLKTVGSLRVNETKLTWRNAFILDLFALGGEKKIKI